MKKVKRIISAILAFILVISMVACSAAQKSEDKADAEDNKEHSYDNNSGNNINNNSGNAGNNSGNNSNADKDDSATKEDAPSVNDGGQNTGDSSNMYGDCELPGSIGDPNFDASLAPGYEDEDVPGESIEGGNSQGIRENPFIKTEEMDTYTMSADVDTASYTFLRKLINQGYSLDELQELAKSNVIRTEELVNYFDYEFNISEDDRVLFDASCSINKAPWNDDTYLMMLGFKAKDIVDYTANNLVFLIDTSGSMMSDDKLPLLKKAFSYLVDQLDGDDTISIVTYAGTETVVLEGAKGNKKQTILDAINGLQAGGSTNGEAGIVKAYEIAEFYFKPSGNNRIILASDGDLNVGISDPEQLKELVAKKRDSGIWLSVLGFGTGNFRDDTMSAIAQNGNGVYHYIDCETEAEKIFTENLLATIHTVAKDVKFQFEFFEDYISEYRLIGYENRVLDNEDFDDDTKDAGDVGAGHTIIICFELKLTEKAFDYLVYDGYSSWAGLAIRYKHRYSNLSVVDDIYALGGMLDYEPRENFIFVSTVIEFSMLLRNSEYAKNEITLESLIERLEGLELDARKAEFKSLLEQLAAREEK